MTCRGIIKGRTIELEQPLPLRDGQSVTISVQAVEEEPPRGSPAAVLKAMHEAPHLEPGDIDEFNRALRESKLPVESSGIFDEDAPG